MRDSGTPGHRTWTSIGSSPVDKVVKFTMEPSRGTCRKLGFPLGFLLLSCFLLGFLLGPLIDILAGFFVGLLLALG